MAKDGAISGKRDDDCQSSETDFLKRDTLQTILTERARAMENVQGKTILTPYYYRLKRRSRYFSINTILSLN